SLRERRVDRSLNAAVAVLWSLAWIEAIVPRREWLEGACLRAGGLLNRAVFAVVRARVEPVAVPVGREEASAGIGVSLHRRESLRRLVIGRRDPFTREDHDVVFHQVRLRGPEILRLAEGLASAVAVELVRRVVTGADIEVHLAVAGAGGELRIVETD